MATQSNFEYLLYNGFVMEDNPNDCVYITFQDQPSTMRDPNKKPLRPLRLCLGTRELPVKVKQWGLAMEVMYQAPGEGKRFLVDFILQKLAKYATTVEEDTAELERLRSRERGDPPTMLAIQMRRHEKVTLRAVVDKLRSGAWDCCNSIS
mmetsp:Transcript_81476/g.219049  ORF Transcript_81476/g.219049 Transcript_81476/m.219049 type:complete len:150 (+) Transcript_81476:92-541(+)